MVLEEDYVNDECDYVPCDLDLLFKFLYLLPRCGLMVFPHVHLSLRTFKGRTCLYSSLFHICGTISGTTNLGRKSEKEHQKKEGSCLGGTGVESGNSMATFWLPEFLGRQSKTDSQGGILLFPLILGIESIALWE